MPTEGSGSRIRSRSVDRLINVSDAVVAVAVTVLVLPLVELQPADGESVWSVMSDHAGQVISFLFTFVVVAIMWSTHNRILNGIVDYDGSVFWLNTLWLLAIVLLPWSSSLYGESSVFSDGPDWPGAGLFYWGTLCVISTLGWAMSVYLRRHPDLLAPEAVGSTPAERRTALRAPVFAGYFLFIGIASVVAPNVAAWLPLGIIALSIWLRPMRGPHAWAA